MNDLKMVEIRVTDLPVAKRDSFKMLCRANNSDMNKTLRAFIYETLDKEERRLKRDAAKEKEVQSEREG